MIGKFNKNNYLFGTVLGLLCTIISVAIIYLILFLLEKNDFENHHKIYLLALIPNILLFRYYIKQLTFEKTGKAILFVTFVILFAYFYYQFRK